MVLEFTGLLWITRRRTLDELRRSESLVSLVAWAGILGLIASGAFLEPNLEDPKTIVKMIAVLDRGDERRRDDAADARADAGCPPTPPFAAIPRSLKLWCVWSALVSQAAWWTAVIIGMLNTASR